MSQAGKTSRWLGGASSLVALVSVLVALALSAGNMVYTFWPSLSPEPKKKVAAKLVTLTMDRNVSYGSFLLRPHPAVRVTAAEDPVREGNVFYLRAGVEGFKCEQLRVRWYTYERHNRQRLTGLGSTAPLEQILRSQASVNDQIAQV